MSEFNWYGYVDGDISNGGNYSPAGVPVMTDDVVFNPNVKGYGGDPSSGSLTVAHWTAMAGATMVAGLTINASSGLYLYGTVSGGTYNLGELVTYSGAEITGGTFALGSFPATGDITNAGEISGGTYTGVGTLSTDGKISGGTWNSGDVGFVTIGATGEISAGTYSCIGASPINNFGVISGGTYLSLPGLVNGATGSISGGTFGSVGGGTTYVSNSGAISGGTFYGGLSTGFTWTGATSGDLTVITNWTPNGDPHGNPALTDLLYFPVDVTRFPSSGTLNNNFWPSVWCPIDGGTWNVNLTLMDSCIVSAGTFNRMLTLFGATLNGGTQTAGSVMGAFGGSITGGTWNCPIDPAQVSISGGTFNSTVNQNAGINLIIGGTYSPVFNGAVTFEATTICVGGTFYGAVNSPVVNTSSFAGGFFHGPVIADGFCGGVFYDSLASHSGATLTEWWSGSSFNSADLSNLKQLSILNSPVFTKAKGING